MSIFADSPTEGLVVYNKKSIIMPTENMVNESLNKKSFDLFDEQDLSLVLNQVARRMLQLRPNTPDIGFWHTTIFRISKFLNSFPNLTEEEKQIIINAKDGAGKVAAVRKMRERTGMRLRACHDIIKDWAEKNITKAGK